MKRDFDSIMESLKSTIASYDYFVDFEKVYKEVEDILIPLNLLNSLIGRDDFDEAYIKLIHEYPITLKALPILIAMRGTEIELLDRDLKSFRFDKLVNSDEEYLKFADKTGIKKLLTQGKITNIVDYVVGVNVGLDSNARKNRTGKSMENLVQKYLEEQTNGHVLTQATKKNIKETFGFDEIDNLNITEGDKQADKRFDFAFMIDDIVYLVETNFYGSGGSKLNEVARSYEKLADEINASKHYRFMWITDGKGWNSTKNGLRESYTHQMYLLTIQDLQKNDLKALIKEYINK